MAKLRKTSKRVSSSRFFMCEFCTPRRILILHTASLSPLLPPLLAGQLPRNLASEPRGLNVLAPAPMFPSIEQFIFFYSGRPRSRSHHIHRNVPTYPELKRIIYEPPGLILTSSCQRRLVQEIFGKKEVRGGFPGSLQ